MVRCEAMSGELLSIFKLWKNMKPFIHEPFMPVKLQEDPFA